ncbi:hypothetical protein GCM10010425_79380 [Streptomyces spororaveus]|uniref:Uncharacterized protein n=1 Tax=Streptomyces spororaveus TaxID=284039 RepID=A0ABQ3TQ84_9ACTN|nr:hypothetical protein Sspor_02710 [Streptomyces spororaveus]GHI82544.1 hypothetical protein Sspor_81050 [Streptomyces spororaveus]GHI82585.1 hypothetical protein Sspor_81460 [Streptomyces spororaveus]
MTFLVHPVLKAGVVTENDLMAELSAVPETCWIFSAHANEAGAVMWLPLTKISETGIWLGLDRKGVWTLGRLDGVVESSAEGLPSSWVTILDADESSLRAGLASAAERFKLSPDGLESLVPVDDVLAMAIRSRSSHWAERAVCWMSERAIPGDQLVLLRGLSTADWANQRTRHTARRLVKGVEQ